MPIYNTYLIICTYLELLIGFLPAIRVHCGHDVDTGVLEEVADKLVALKILITQVDDKAQQHLFAHHLVAMHVSYILELGFLCNNQCDPILTFSGYHKTEIRRLYRVLLQGGLLRMKKMQHVTWKEESNTPMKQPMKSDAGGKKAILV